MTAPLQLWEPVLALGGAAFIVYFEIQLGRFLIANRDRWLRRFRASRLYRWLDTHEPGVRINCRDGSSLAVGWFR